VGCPIRRSRDQRSLASPPGFSQRATSFIASQCQGIHQMPFSCFSRHTQRQTSPAKRKRFAAGVRRNQLVSPKAIDAPGLTRGPSGARSRRCSRNACRGRRNCRSAVAILSIQKTLHDGTHRPEKPHMGKTHGQGDPGRGFRRGHNSLLHNCPSATPRPAARTGGAILIICRDV
jgi:hypothetical protein